MSDGEPRRVRVVRCGHSLPQHEGKAGWLLDGDHVSLPDEGTFMVNLDGPIDRVFGTSGLLCVATEIEEENP